MKQVSAWIVESLEHQQHYPQAGWVEHDAEEIWQNVLAATSALLERNADLVGNVACMSITNQRETVVIFDRETGRPLYPAIVWQCRRSVELCNSLESAGHGPLIHSRSGLRIDAYFSGSKLQWLVQNQPGLGEKLANGDALIGTIDTYLIYRLTDGKVFATEPTNASRTLLFDIGRLQWDDDLCSLFEVPANALADVRDSDAHFGETILGGALRSPLPIVGVMGDSQGALFAQRCFEPGTAKVTFGTGSSVMMNIGSDFKLSKRSAVTALGWVQNGTPAYAFEGIIISSGATLTWLQAQLGLVEDVTEIESLASELDDSGGVFLVPAFSGLGLPHWEGSARAAIVGLSTFSDKRHVARAALESMAYQLRDALDAMQAEGGVELTALKADGGPTANKLLMQFTADVTESELAVSEAPDCSALGATLMGLLGIGVYDSLAEIKTLELGDRVFQPSMPAQKVNSLLADWQQAVGQVLAAVPNSDQSETT